MRKILRLQIGLPWDFSDLIKSPTPPSTTKQTCITAPWSPTKFSISSAIDGRGYRVEATGGIDLTERMMTAGIYFTLVEESGSKYQLLISMFDDLNNAGKKLQKAINNLMSVPDQPVATTAVGQQSESSNKLPSSPPSQPSPSKTDLSDLLDVVKAVLSYRLWTRSTGPRKIRLGIH